MGSARDEERERRISMEIVVDAYGPEEQAMGWYYSLEDRLGFPFCGQVRGRACHLAVAGRRRAGGGRDGAGCESWPRRSGRLVERPG